MILLVAALPSAASADERFALRWEAPDGCPGRDAVHAEVARLVGGRIPPGEPIAAEGRTIAAEGAFELTLRTDVAGQHGERTVRADRCDELAAAAALILALMIDPEAVARAEPEPTPLAPSLARALAPPAREVEPPRAAPAPDARRAAEPFTEAGPPSPARDGRLEALFGAGIQLDVGTLPAVAPALVIEGGFGVPLIDGRVRLAFLFPQAGTSAELAGASAELMAFTAGVLACLRPIEQARALGLCADVAAGSVFGAARGISEPRFGGGFWLAAGGGLALAWQPAPWFDLEGMAEILGQIVAPAFEVLVGGPGGERTIVLFQPPAVAGRFTLAAHVRF